MCWLSDYNNMVQVVEKKRIEYIDAMRGLAMLLVVVGHVLKFAFHDGENILLHILSEELQIPLFFIVSGFLVRIPENNYFSFIKKKAFLFCVPAAIFMTAYVWKCNFNFVSAWVDSCKFGYWFTFSLFEFYCCFTVLKCISRGLKLNRNAETIFLLVIAVVALYASTWCMRMEKTCSFIPLLGLVQFKSFIYFALGAVLAEYNVLRNNASWRNKMGGAY